MTIPFITDEQIRQKLSHEAVCRVLDEAFLDLSKDNASILARHRIDCQDVKLSTMGAIWKSRQLACVKNYTTINGQFSFLITVFDASSNTVAAVLEANELTRFRTAALTRLFASKTVKPTAKKLTLFGAGLQGKTQVQTLCEAFSFTEVAIVTPHPDKAWCKQISEQYHCKVTIASPQEAVSDADLVVTATRSKTPVFDGTWLKSGATVIAMGTSLPNGRELDDATLTRAAYVAVEWHPQSLIEAGEIVLGMASGALQREKIVDLSELYQSQQPWRRTDDDIVVFKSVGVGLADLACASLIVEGL